MPQGPGETGVTDSDDVTTAGPADGDPRDRSDGIAAAGPTATAARLLPRILVRIIGGLVVMGLMLMLPAGTWRFWPGWLFLAALFGPMMVMTVYFLRRDPAVLERRLKTRERESTQAKAIAVFGVVSYGSLLLAGFDHRFGWSHVPVAVVIVANLVIVLGFAAFFWVLRTNAYAARTIEVEAEQEVISTGPYAVVRHPMYSAMVPIMVAMPLALASWWALPPMLLVIPVLVVRISNEEQLLRRELPGYTEYCQQVRWRLVPGVW